MCPWCTLSGRRPWRLLLKDKNVCCNFYSQCLTSHPFFYSPYFVTRGMLMHHEPLCLYTLTQHSVLDFMELTIACLDREGGLWLLGAWISQGLHVDKLTQISLHALLNPEWSTKGLQWGLWPSVTEHVLAKWIGRYECFSQNAQNISQRGYKSIIQWLNCDLPKLLPFADDIFVFFCLDHPQHAN